MSPEQEAARRQYKLERALRSVDSTGSIEIQRLRTALAESRAHAINLHRAVEWLLANCTAPTPDWILALFDTPEHSTP